MTTKAASHQSKASSMTIRHLRDGRTVSELPQSVAVSLQTRCPGKWAFVDLETGQIWIHDQQHGFVRATRGDTQLVHQVAASASAP